MDLEVGQVILLNNTEVNGHLVAPGTYFFVSTFKQIFGDDIRTKIELSWLGEREARNETWVDLNELDIKQVYDYGTQVEILTCNDTVVQTKLAPEVLSFKLDGHIKEINIYSDYVYVVNVIEDRLEKKLDSFLK